MRNILVVCCQLPFFLGEGMWTLIVIKLLTFCICVFLVPPFVNNNEENENDSTQLPVALNKAKSWL